MVLSPSSIGQRQKPHGSWYAIILWIRGVRFPLWSDMPSDEKLSSSGGQVPATVGNRVCAVLSQDPWLEGDEVWWWQWQQGFFPQVCKFQRGQCGALLSEEMEFIRHPFENNWCVAAICEEEVRAQPGVLWGLEMVLDGAFKHWISSNPSRLHFTNPYTAGGDLWHLPAIKAMVFSLSCWLLLRNVNLSPYTWGPGEKSALRSKVY